MVVNFPQWTHQFHFIQCAGKACTDHKQLLVTGTLLYMYMHLNMHVHNG